MDIAQRDLSWPSRDAAVTIDGFVKFSTGTPFMSPVMRLEAPDHVGFLYPNLPPHVCIIPAVKFPLTARIDDPAWWTKLRARLLDQTAACERCGRPRSDVAMLDIEVATRDWVINGNPAAEPNWRRLYDHCIPIIADACRELMVFPAVIHYPGREAEVRARSAKLCEAIERPSAGDTPMVRWISNACLGPQALTDPQTHTDFSTLKAFTRSEPVAKLYFYEETSTVQFKWRLNQYAEAVAAATRLDMSDRIIYPGQNNWPRAALEIPPQMPRIA